MKKKRLDRMTDDELIDYFHANVRISYRHSGVSSQIYHIKVGKETVTAWTKLLCMRRFRDAVRAGVCV